jgi:hypothetical protein
MARRNPLKTTFRTPPIGGSWRRKSRIIHGGYFVRENLPSKLTRLEVARIRGMLLTL